jgi:hypothetical protein
MVRFRSSGSTSSRGRARVSSGRANLIINPTSSRQGDLGHHFFFCAPFNRPAPQELARLG